MSQKIIFYDGECPLCSRAVIYFLKIDKNEVLRYAPLEGETAKEKMGDEYDEIIKRDTVVYYDGDGFYFETKALIKALWAIDGYDWLGWLIWIVPYFIRDAIYRIIANNRKKIFDTCPMIPKEQRHLFLD